MMGDMGMEMMMDAETGMIQSIQSREQLEADTENDFDDAGPSMDREVEEIEKISKDDEDD